MFCTKCGNQKNSEKEACQNCEQQVQEELPAPKTPKQKFKSFLVSAVSIVVFLLAFGIMRVLTDEGLSFFEKKKNTQETQNTVVNYFTDTSSWKEFNSTLGGFKASFPSYPTHETTPLDILELGQPINMEMYSSEHSDDIIYAVTFIAYPPSIELGSNSADNLEGSVNGSIQATGGTLISSSFSTFAGHSAIDYLVYISDKGMYTKGKNILVGKTLYQIVAIYESKNSTKIEFDKFVNSFQLL